MSFQLPDHHIPLIGTECDDASRSIAEEYGYPYDKQEQGRLCYLGTPAECLIKASQIKTVGPSVRRAFFTLKHKQLSLMKDSSSLVLVLGKPTWTLRMPKGVILSFLEGRVESNVGFNFIITKDLFFETSWEETKIDARPFFVDRSESSE